MRNKNQLAISIAAALYTAGIAASTNTLQSQQNDYVKPDFLEEIVITQEMVERSEARNHRRNRFTGETEKASFNNNNNQVNQHRAVVAKVPFQWDPAISGEHTYIVEFTDQSVSLYDGRVTGYDATNLRLTDKPSVYIANQNAYKINTQDPAVRDYVQYLQNQQRDHIANISRAIGQSIEPRRTFQYALNGASMVLTQEQASHIANLPGVRNVQLSKNYELLTDVGPKHIKADKVWPLANSNAMTTKGEGVVMGIIDTGINSDHPSFAAQADDGYVHTNPRGRFYGDCEAAEFAHMCNAKLIGVRSYDVITDTYWSPAYQEEYAWHQTPEAPIRPENGEDYQGHGSHTAATAAGNELFDVAYRIPELTVTSDGTPTDLIFPHISGVAPRANIIAYQTCYANDGSLGDENSPTAQWQGCPAEALVAAIEDAIQDGVDVINFSIGGGESNPWEDSVEMAFLSAREAGISAALAAGNSGWSNIDHPSPWVTSVAATTHGREISYSPKYLQALSGGDSTPPTDITGKGYTESFSGHMVLASAYGDESCNSPFAEGTFSDNQIVVCKRGKIARVDKAVNVQAGGAGAMVLYNGSYTENDVMPTDPYVIPGILINSYDGANLVNWLSTGSDHSATISASSMDVTQGIADFVADFSSRGPSRVIPDSMVPNVGAPGVNVFAAYADDQPFTAAPLTTDYRLNSGTSMAAPHVAGAMALLTQLHPDWTPAEIQSALMTTAHEGTSTINYWGDIGAAGIDDFGSGIIDVEQASKVGLVLDENADNYRAANPFNGGDLPSLNEAYLFNMNCEFDCTWIRTFRATEDGTWSIDMTENTGDGLALLNLSAHPSTFSLKKGEVKSVMFTAAVKDISNPINSTKDAIFEGLVTVTPQSASMPTQKLPMRVQFSGDGLPNNASFDIHRQTGSQVSAPLYTKEVNSVTVNGLVKGQSKTHNLAPIESGKGIQNYPDLDSMPGLDVIHFNVPEGTKRLIFENH
ncbi:S8 family serine peptidase [Pseudoalteromonas sp. GB56]